MSVWCHKSLFMVIHRCKRASCWNRRCVQSNVVRWRRLLATKTHSSDDEYKKKEDKIAKLKSRPNIKYAGKDVLCLPHPQRRVAEAFTQEEVSSVPGRKLRRGDKFTDLQFLRSPVFKPEPGARRSVQGDPTSRKSHKYNESFVGCRWCVCFWT